MKISNVIKVLLLLFFLTIIIYDQAYEQEWDFEAEFLSRYDSKAGFDKGGAEIVVYSPDTYKVYVTNAAEKSVDILDLSNPEDIKLSRQVCLKDIVPGYFKAGDITSAAVHPEGKYLAAAVSADPVTDKGIVVFISCEGDYLGFVEAGYLPDMLCFTPDGSTVLVANEGEPNEDYTVDPHGSITYIDVSRGIDEAQRFDITFKDLRDEQVEKGVRIFGKNAVLAQDLEPEYITVSPDSRTAYVVLQENNALAEIDLVKKKVKFIYSFGFKDHSIEGNELDVSDKDGKINIRNWPLLGMYLPDGIDSFTDNGQLYIVTANEGDTRDYEGFSEEIRVIDIVNRISLDADNYKGYTQEEIDTLVSNNLFAEGKLGRIKITSTLGQNDEGVYEALYSYGGRSFSIWKPTSSGLELVYDSGSDFEKILARKIPQYFNTDHKETRMDGRSDDRGPEPEDVEIGIINGKRYVFISLERISGIMVYDITDPENPVFKEFFTGRDYKVQLSYYSEGDRIESGDVGPEGLCFIPAEKSPNAKPLLLTANEVSGTVAVYEVDY